MKEEPWRGRPLGTEEKKKRQPPHYHQGKGIKSKRSNLAAASLIEKKEKPKRNVGRKKKELHREGRPAKLPY